MRALRHVLEGADGLLWTVDFVVDSSGQHWRPVFFNVEAARRLLLLEAKTPEEMAALWEEARLPEERVAVQQRYFHAIREREGTFAIEYRARDRHGTLHWLRDHVRVQTIGDRAWRFLVVTTNVSHERRASDVVSRTLRVLGHTLESSRAILWSADVTPEGDYEHWNLCLYNFPVARNLLPLDADTPDAYVRAWRAALPEAAQQEAAIRWKRALERREAFYQQVFPLVDASGASHLVREDIRIEYLNDALVRVVIVSTLLEGGEAASAPPDVRATPEPLDGERAVPDLPSERSTVSAEMLTTLARARCCLWYADVCEQGGKLRFDLHIPHCGTGGPLAEALAASEPRNLWLQAISAREKRALYKIAEDALRSGAEHFVQEYWLRCADGSALRLRNDVSVVSIGSGCWSLVAVVTDVTELHSAQQMLDSLVSGARCILWHADIVREGAKFHWDLHLPYPESARRLLTLKHTEDVALLDAWRARISPEDLATMDARADAALQSGASAYANLFQIRDDNGELFWFSEEVSLESVAPNRWRAVGVLTDVTAQQKALLELEASEERYSSLVEHLPVGVYRLAPDGSFALANAALAAMLGYESVEALQRAGADVLGEQHQALRERLDSEGVVRGWEGIWQRADGAPIAVRQSAMAVRDGSGSVCYYEGTVEDVTERQRTFDLIKRQATLDPLTELPNRSMVREQLEQAVTLAGQRGGKVGVLYVDLDKFKQVNDLFGHDTGDRLLVQMAQRLRRATRPSDLVARTGGDEFLIVAPDVLDADETARLAGRVRRVVQEPAEIDGERFELDSSIGTVLYPQDGEDAETLMRNADIAMYHAKSSGGGVKSFASSMHEEMRERVTLEADLRRALTNNEFVLYFQPQLDAVTGRITGVEALVRWEHPERGLLPPSQFIPLAEETGLIIALGEWVLKEACQQGAKWRQAGIDLRMAVNVSPRQFAQRELPRIVARALDDSSFDADKLDLELTESTLLEHERSVETSIAALRCLGVGLQIDDFGTGYSSLALLRRYRMEALKIDQGFIRGIRESAEDAAIVRSVVELAHTLGMVVVAEGVETAWHYECLRGLGCDFVQGFHFSPPVAASEVPGLTQHFGMGS